MQSKPSSPKLNESHSLTDALRVDRFRLSRIRKRISQESFEQQVSESVEKKRLRESIQPRLEYSKELPITQYRQELIQKIHSAERYWSLSARPGAHRAAAAKSLRRRRLDLNGGVRPLAEERSPSTGIDNHFFPGPSAVVFGDVAYGFAVS